MPGPVAPRLEVSFFRATSGREPVREWLLALTKDERRTIGADIAYVQYKWPMSRPQVGHLRGDLKEVRSNLKNRIARVLFAVSGTEMILLHGFIKTSRTIPAGDMDLAQARWKEWRNAEAQ